MILRATYVVAPALHGGDNETQSLFHRHGLGQITRFAADDFTGSFIEWSMRTSRQRLNKAAATRPGSPLRNRRCLLAPELDIQHLPVVVIRITG